MYDYITTTRTRSSRALEIAMNARDTEKRYALMAAELKAHGETHQNRAARSLITRLLATLRIF